MSRPCRYCLAAYPILFENGETGDCELTHRDEQRIYDLAVKLASVFQHRPPSDEQVAWFLDDADAIVDDFGPVPDRWRVRRLPESSYDKFECRFRVNDVTYICQAGGKDSKSLPVRLSTYRQWMREANEAARSRT